MRLIIAGAGCLLAVSGCSLGPDIDQQSGRLVAVRMDGQPVSGNPRLQTAMEADMTICLGEQQKSIMSGSVLTTGSLSSEIAGALASAERDAASYIVLKGCLAQRGYMLVPEREAAARLAEYQARAASSTISATPAVATAGR